MGRWPGRTARPFETAAAAHQAAGAQAGGAVCLGRAWGKGEEEQNAEVEHGEARWCDGEAWRCDGKLWGCGREPQGIAESHRAVKREHWRCDGEHRNYETSSAGPVLCTLGSGIPRSHRSVAALALQLPGKLQHRCF